MSQILFLLSSILLLASSNLLAAETSSLEKGRTFLDEGKTGLAIIAFDEFKQENPKDIRGYLYSGEAMIQAGHMQDASIEVSQALQIGPGNYQQTVELAEVLIQLNRPNLATDLLLPLKEKNRLESKGLWLLADSYFRQRRFDDCLNTLLELESRQDFDREEIYLLRGSAFLQLGELEQSMTAFEQVTAANQNSSEAFHGLAEVCYRGNNPEAALEMSSRAVALQPDNALYLHLLGVVEKALGRNDMAITHLERAIELDSNSQRAYFDLGDLYRKTGEVEKATANLMKSQDLLGKLREKQEIEQLISLGDELLQQGKIEEAIVPFQGIIELDQQQWVAHNRLAKIYFAKGEVRKAHSHLEFLLMIDPNSSESNLMMAAYWFGLREFPKALEYALKSKELRPGDATLRRLLGDIYFALGKKLDAIDEYGAASRLAPGTAQN